MNQMLKVSAS